MNPGRDFAFGQDSSWPDFHNSAHEICVAEAFGELSECVPGVAATGGFGGGQTVFIGTCTFGSTLQTVESKAMIYAMQDAIDKLFADAHLWRFSPLNLVQIGGIFCIFTRTNIEDPLDQAVTGLKFEFLPGEGTFDPVCFVA